MRAGRGLLSIPSTLFRTPCLYNPPMQSLKLAKLAEYLDATLLGDPSAEITRVAGIENAEPGDLTFVSNPKYAALARTTNATAILVEPGFPEVRTATLRVDNPYLAFAFAIELFYRSPLLSGCPSHCRDLAYGQHWGECPYRRLCGNWRQCHDWR